jgi:hypothetical protein
VGCLWWSSLETVTSPTRFKEHHMFDHLFEAGKKKGMKKAKSGSKKPAKK